MAGRAESRVGWESRRARHGVANVACCLAELVVSAAFGITVADLRAPRRGPAEVAFARQVAMYLAHVTLGQRLYQVARHFGRDRTTVAHACARVEDRRDDELVDRTLCVLETVLGEWRRRVSAGAGR